MPTPTPSIVDAAKSGAAWTVPQGFAGSFTVQLRDQYGNPYTAFDGTQVLAGVVWPGENTPALISFTPTWANAGAGQIAVMLTSMETTGLDVGQYQWDVFISDRSVDLARGTLEVAYTPGSQAALTTYCAYQDLLDRAPWLEKLQKPTDLQGFLKQRAQARQWFEDLLYRHYRSPQGVFSDYYFTPADFGGLWGSFFLYRDGRRSTDLTTWLAANYLSVTQPVIEATACFAIALVCDRQVVPGRDDNGYAAIARKYFARAEDAASNISAELDTNGDGITDVVIRLGTTDTLEG